MAEDDLNGMWASEDAAAPGEPENIPADPPAPNPLAEQVAELRGTVGALTQHLQAQQPVAQPPEEYGPNVPVYEDQEWFNDDELLNSKTPSSLINNALNTMARSQQDQFNEILETKDAELREYQAGIENRAQQVQLAAASNQSRETFYGAHPDLVGDEWLVGQATQQVMQDVSARRWAYQDDQAIYDAIYNNSIAAKTAVQERWNGAEETVDKKFPAPPGANSPSRRATSGMSGGARAQSAKAPATVQGKALQAMHEYNQRR
jgi:hypothetical protein